MCIELIDEKIRSNRYYSVGYCPKINKYILVNVVTWIIWYNQYYEISKEEYNSFGSTALDELADTLYRDGYKSKRFLFSDKQDENNTSQTALRTKCLK